MNWGYNVESVSNCRTNSKITVTIILLFWTARKFSLFFPGLGNNCTSPREDQIRQPMQKWQYYGNSLLFPSQRAVLQRGTVSSSPRARVKVNTQASERCANNSVTEITAISTLFWANTNAIFSTLLSLVLEHSKQICLNFPKEGKWINHICEIMALHFSATTRD